MAPMLPTARAHRVSLADVLTNSLGAIRGRSGRLGLPRVRTAIVVVVDGLGSQALAGAAGHARFLAARAAASGGTIDGVVPSTTAAALASLTTGEQPGVHGMTGYTVLDPARDRVGRQLDGDRDALDPGSWQRARTQFELAAASGIGAIAIGPRRYAGSWFTRAVLRGAEYRAAESVSERVDRALAEARGPDEKLVYVYLPELDVAGHAGGIASARWLAGLEDIDAALSTLAASMPPRAGALVTADHGMIDVAPERHVVVGEVELAGVRHIAGEPRFLHLHLVDPDLGDRVLDAWSGHARRAWLGRRDDAIAAGWFGRVDREVVPRIGDVIVAAKGSWAFYADANDRGRGMVGQHGSITRAELDVPLVRLGAFER